MKLTKHTDITNLRPQQLREILSNPLNTVSEDFVNQCIAKFTSEYEINARSKSTHKTLESHWRLFTQDCIAKGVKSLPASSMTVVAYLRGRQESGVHRNTIRQDIYAINRMHKMCGLPLPKDDEKVVDVVKAIVRENHRNGETIKQAKGFTLTQDVKDMLESDNVKDIRDAALMIVGFTGLMRSSEIRNIQIKHVSFMDNGNVQIEIPQSKTNQAGESEYKVLPSVARNAIETWLNVRGVAKRETEFLFVGVSRHGKTMKHTTALSLKTLNDLIKNVDEELTSHSMRVGGAQTLHKAGVDSRKIMIAGGWTNEANMVRYIKGAESKESAFDGIF